MRAALALGYYDYSKGNYRAGGEMVCPREGRSRCSPDYALYWAAETDLAMGHSADALAELKQFRSKFPPTR